jgi:TPR repeat protein
MQYLKTHFRHVVIFIFAVAGALDPGLWCQAQTSSLNEVRSRALSGDSSALIDLAQRFRIGSGGAVRNPDSANYYLRTMAEKNFSDAQFLWGTTLLRGLDTPQNPVAGFEWIRKAAQQNQKNAILSLLELYGSTEQNVFLRTQFYNPQKALEIAAQGRRLRLPQAYVYAGQTLLNPPPRSGIQANDSLGIAYLDTAAVRLRFLEAQLLLGDLFFLAKNNRLIDFDRARRYYELVYENPKADVFQQTYAELQLLTMEEWKKRFVNYYQALFLPQIEKNPMVYKP